MLLLPLLHGRMQVDGCRRGINPWLLAPPAGTLADAVPATLAPLPGIALGLGLGRCLASRAVVLLSHRLGMRILGNGGGSHRCSSCSSSSVEMQALACGGSCCVGRQQVHDSEGCIISIWLHSLCCQYTTL